MTTDTKSQTRVRVGLAMPPKPPVASLHQALTLARLLRLDSFLIWDHLEDLFPRALWNPRTTWLAREGESPHQFLDFQTMLGNLAARAGRVRLGVAVTEPIRRHPVMIAQAMLTLAHLTRQAPILGIGAGERTNIEPYGLSFEGAVGRLEDALRVIRLCLDHEDDRPLNYAGSHYRLENAHFDLKAPKGRKPRIWLGAHGPRMLRLTGQYGDGWYPTGALSPEQYQAKLQVIQDAARTAGRDPSRIMPTFQATVVAASSEREARALLGHPMIRYMGLLLPASAWADIGHEHPFGSGFGGFVHILPEAYPEAELRAAMDAVPLEELAGAGLIWGTPDRVIARLREYVEAGMRYVVPQLPALAISRRDALYQVRMLHMIRRAFR